MMNEQLILKLVDDAELDIVFNPDMPDYKWVEGTEEDLMKLIELVVLECAKKGFEVFNEEPDAPASDLQFYVRDRIKSHFGV